MDDQRLESAVSKRNKQFTRLKGCYELAVKVDKAATAGANVDEMKDFISFATRMDKIELIYEGFERIAEQIMELNPKVSTEKQVTDLDNVTAVFDEYYYFCKSVYRKLAPRAKLNESFNASCSGLPPNQTSHAHLQRIQIASFNGDIEKWSDFHSLYESLIHKSDNLSPVEKFHYLKSFLGPKPLAYIQSLSITEANYQIAWQTILDRYHRKRLLASHFISSILDFRQINEPTHGSLAAFLRVFDTNVTALNALRIRDNYDNLLFHIAVRNLDARTRKEFEMLHSDKEFPALKDVIKYVEDQCKIHEVTNDKPKSNKTATVTASNSGKTKTSLLSLESQPSASNSSCVLCNKSTHSYLYFCDQFKQLPLNERHNVVKRLNRCSNCLGNHYINQCKSTRNCRHCQEKHSSLLHNFDKTKENTSSHLTCAIANGQVSPCGIDSFTSDNQSMIMLSTAVVYILDKFGQPQKVRILVDQGSMVNIMTSSCAERLGLKINRNSRSINALGGVVRNSHGFVQCTITPCDQPLVNLNTTALIIPHISDVQPQRAPHPSIRQNLGGLKLADPDFDVPSQIDFLLGAELYPQILNASHNFISGEPAAISTCFGWMLVGKTLVNSTFTSPAPFSLVTTTLQSLDHTLRNFWEVEEIGRDKPVDPEDEICEHHYAKTHYRLPSGRYVVRLPFKDKLSTLPDNRQLALNRFYSLEKRLTRTPSQYEEYQKFMQEYISLNHMSRSCQPSSYVIPHHIVLRNDSSTTRLRTVFDASFRPNPGGHSLNSLLMTGPKLQRDIGEILSNFRTYAVVVCADIKMMFRQVLIDPADRDYQHIFYRSSPASDVEEFSLHTVTYGLNCSPFLAERTLLQLIKDEGKQFPLASNAISNDIYVDDVCSGSDDVTSALRLQRELIDLLELGGFSLRKWSSNHPAILHAVPLDHLNAPLTFSSADHSLKILGIQYDPVSDVFSFSIQPTSIRITKRGVLSEIGRIYDPLGWVTPISFHAKHFMQQLWIRGLDWDEALPPDLLESWNDFIAVLPALSNIRISRLIPVTSSTKNMLFGFCDASEKGYSAVLYVTTCHNDVVHAHLLKAKSRVSPLRTMSIPRLELSGAQLLSQLVVSVQPFIQRAQISCIQLFTDSTIVLSWLRTPPHKLKTFVANRVVDILTITSPQQWHHVPSTKNPADPASRGLLGDELVNCKLWWNGPEFICKPLGGDSNNLIVPSSEYLEELKSQPVESLLISTKRRYLLDVLEKYSSFTKAQRIFAYILRYIHNRFCKRDNRIIGPLTPPQLRESTAFIIRLTQRHHFQSEINAIRKGNALNSLLKHLNPFIDKDGLLRVEGRIGRSKLPFSSRHPLIIPHNSHCAKLICDYYHVITLHGGPRVTAALLNRQYWIPSLRKLLRLRIHRCLKCYLPRADAITPMMSDLPEVRIEGHRPFLDVSVDYGGPYLIRESLRRNAPKSKCYLAVFVCLEVKAVHLELSHDLSAESFLRVLDRFVARRGVCRYIYSDNGTNFQGASRELEEVYQMLTASCEQITNYLSKQHIEWRFSPPTAAHFNGLAEAAIKSAKHHIGRVLGNQVMTFEELSTLLARVEAVLNSRPLGTISSDPLEASDYLSPGHFLVGMPLLAVPEANVLDIPLNRLNRHQLIQQSAQAFWKRWKSEYLPSLIPREKWTDSTGNLIPGDVVFIRKIDTPPLHWPIGRILEVYPGKDNVTRVAKVRTSSGEYVRPVHNMVPLPPLN